jgi:hypothetical protein
MEFSDVTGDFNGHERPCMNDDFVDTFYEAAFVAELWPVVLNRMATLSMSMGAAMFLFVDGRPTRGVALDSQRTRLK